MLALHFATTPGDLDLDGDVDNDDLNSMGAAYNVTGLAWGWSDGDFNGDGDVDSSDLVIYGQEGY